jgi:hypothetical protein
MLARCYRPIQGFDFWSLYQVRPVPNKERNDFVVTATDGHTIVLHEDEFNKHFRCIPIKEKGRKLWDDIKERVQRLRS